MKILRKGAYKILALLLLLSVAFSCEDDDNDLAIISGLDFNIATLNVEGTETGIIALTVGSDNRIVYTVDFGNPDDTEDVFQTSGPMVTYTYPELEESVTYIITVTASLEGKDDVSISKEHTVIYTPPVVIPTGPTNPLSGTWRLAPEAGSLAVGPGLLDGSGAPWWSIPAEDVVTRACIYDDEYVFNDDGTFQNVLQGETWNEPIGDPAQDCFGTIDGVAACGTPAFPYDGTASATFEFNQAAESLTITGKGAFLGLPKVINGGEICPADAADEITYIAKLDGDVLDVFVQTDAANNAYWYYKLVRDAAPTIVGTWKLAPEAGSLAVGPGLLDGSGAPWWSIPAEDVVTRACIYDDEYVFNEDGTFQNVLQGETWNEPIGDPAQDCYGTTDGEAACGTPAFPFDGTASATYDFNQAGESLVIDGKGAFLGLPKVINGGEICPADAADSLEYIAKLDGNILEIFIQTDAANNAYWYYKLIKE